MMQEETGQGVEEYIPDTLDEYLSFHAADIKRIAERKWSRQGFCEPEDVEQAIFEHVILKWEFYKGSDLKSSRGKFNKAASQYLAQEANDYMYFSGSFIYTPDMVRRILESSTWSEVEQAPDIEGRVDVRAHFEKLTKTQQLAVFRRYGMKIAPEDTAKTEQRNVQRGVDKICHELNKSTGKPRTYSMDELRQKLAQQL